MEQLSFLDQVTKAAAKPTWQQILEAGLKANRMDQLDRIERLELANDERMRRTQCETTENPNRHPEHSPQPAGAIER